MKKKKLEEINDKLINDLVVLNRRLQRERALKTEVLQHLVDYKCRLDEDEAEIVRRCITIVRQTYEQ